MPNPSGLEFCIDRPVAVAGCVAHPYASRLILSGWVAGSVPVQSVVFVIDDVSPHTAEYGMPRPDVFEARPGLVLAGESGFRYIHPAGALAPGPHSITLCAVANGMAIELTRFTIDDERVGLDAIDHLRKPPAAERRSLPPAENRPFFVCWIRAGGADAAEVAAVMDTLAGQSYPDFLAVVSCGDADLSAKVALKKSIASGLRDRFVILGSEDELVTDAFDHRELWLMTLDAGVRLADDALATFARRIADDPGSDLIYADERQVDPERGVLQDIYKPDWSPDLLTSTNYIGSTWCVAIDLFNQVFESLRDLDDVGSYDAILACSEAAQAIDHIPVVLSQRRVPSEGPDAERAALARMAGRRRLNAVVEPGLRPGSYRVRPASDHGRMVSIIIPTCCRDERVIRCVSGIRKLSTAQSLEIVCVENTPRDGPPQTLEWLGQNVDRLIRVDETFNWSRFNNIGTRSAHGDLLLFLNDDTEVVQPDWLEALMADAVRSEVGIVGPMLLYPDLTIQHAGMCMTGAGGFVHPFRSAPAADPGYFGLALTRRNVLCLTGACMMMKRSVFDRIGGFDERHAIVNNDVDACLRALSNGLRNIYTPFSRLVHHEGVSRSNLGEIHDAAAFTEDWGEVLRLGDPYSNPNLDDPDDPYDSACAMRRSIADGPSVGSPPSPLSRRAVLG